jgi:hypothetical protein
MHGAPSVSNSGASAMCRIARRDVGQMWHVVDSRLGRDPDAIRNIALTFGKDVFGLVQTAAAAWHSTC